MSQTVDFEIWSWNVGVISNSKGPVWVRTPCSVIKHAFLSNYKIKRVTYRFFLDKSFDDGHIGSTTNDKAKTKPSDSYNTKGCTMSRICRCFEVTFDPILIGWGVIFVRRILKSGKVFFYCRSVRDVTHCCQWVSTWCTWTVFGYTVLEM